MASLLPGLLLCLFLQCVPAFTELCKLENPMDGGNFSLSVSPAYYKPNTTYTVTISGNKDEVMVALSAYSGGNATGTWKNNAANCTGYSATRNLTFYEMWTSSSSPKHYVTFKAYVSIFSNMSYVMNKTIRAVPTTATPNVTKSSTMSMNTMTMTGTTVAASTMTATSTMSSTTPKGGAIAFKPLGGFASMLLLFVTVRELLL